MRPIVNDEVFSLQIREIELRMNLDKDNNIS